MSNTHSPPQTPVYKNGQARRKLTAEDPVSFLFQVVQTAETVEAMFQMFLRKG